MGSVFYPVLELDAADWCSATAAVILHVCMQPANSTATGSQVLIKVFAVPCQQPQYGCTSHHSVCATPELGVCLCNSAIPLATDV
jgi:hypothetical protein